MQMDGNGAPLDNQDAYGVDGGPLAKSAHPASGAGMARCVSVAWVPNVLGCRCDSLEMIFVSGLVVARLVAVETMRARTLASPTCVT